MNELLEFNKQFISQNNEIKKQIPKICINIKKLEQSIPANSNFELSNQLVNKIIEKRKKLMNWIRN